MTEPIYLPRIKTSDIPEGFKPRGALLKCIKSCPNFYNDLGALVRERFVIITSPEICEWLKSKTSLAEYFKWACDKAKPVPRGFWASVENAFGMKRHSLRKLAGRNGNECKPDESRDFLKIKPLLQQLHTQEQNRQYERQVYKQIKQIILFEVKDEEPETIHKIYEKIFAIINKNCGQINAK